MKGLFVCLIVAASVFSSTTADAQVREPVFFKTVTPCDVLTGVGLYVKDVGCKTATGAKTVLEGTASIITSPFRAKFHWPKPRFYRYERGYFVPPKLERLPVKPPKVNLGEPVPESPFRVPQTEELIPLPYYEPELRNTIVLFERRF